MPAFFPKLSVALVTAAIVVSAGIRGAGDAHAAPLPTSPATRAATIVPARAAATGDTLSSLTWIPGSSLKIEQMIGDHDWQDTLRAVRGLTVTRADVLGNGLGYSFVSGDSLIFLFGDTIGASSQYVPRWASVLDSLKWAAADPMAWCDTTDPDSLLFLQFYKKTLDTTLTVLPVYPDGRLLDMGADDIPNAGIDLDSRLWLVCSTGTSLAGGDSSHANDSSVVVLCDPLANSFGARRTMSRAGEGGHFVMVDLHELPIEFAASPTDSEVMIFGVGQYRHSDIYLSKIRKGNFGDGLNGQGLPATRYFAGWSNGQPVWSDSESASVPIVEDDPLHEIGIGLDQLPWPDDTPTIGNLSVAWFPPLQLWLMTFDGGRQSPTPSMLKQTRGVYFSYAKAPWGPWILPQQIYNDTRDGGFGAYIHQYDHNTDVGIGPAGPTIGDQSTNDPDTTSGGAFAPQIIEPFVRIVGDTLLLDYALSTWNPYAVVRMRSKFLIQPGQVLGAAAPAAPLTALELAPDPFRSGTRVRFSLPEEGPVDVAVYDVAGRRVRTLQRGVLAAGVRTLVWDGTTDAGARAPAGLYLVRVRAAGGARVRRVVRLD